MHAYIVLSWLTGAQTEELRALTWSHVDLDGEPPSVQLWRSVREGGADRRRQVQHPAGSADLGAQDADHNAENHRVRAVLPHKCVQQEHRHDKAARTAKTIWTTRRARDGFAEASAAPPSTCPASAIRAPFRILRRQPTGAPSPGSARGPGSRRLLT
jgi:hypothetical protein